MIAYIRGLYTDSDEATITVEAGGIGYRIFVPVTVFAQLPPRGSEVLVHTFFKVAEDGFSLFGFLDKEELALFKQLITVSGVGPKAGISILSTLSVRDLLFAIVGEDDKAISAAPGVGPKTAKRVIVELKDKVDITDASGGVSAAELGASAAEIMGSDAGTEAVLALEALGYSKGEALKAIANVAYDEQTPAELIIRGALRFL